jgi:hypothetical protein
VLDEPSVRPLHQRLFVVASLVVSIVAGCDTKTEQQVYDEAKPAAAALRAKTVAAAQLVQKQPPPAAGAKCKTTKKLTFDPKSDAHDTDFIMFEEAKRGGARRENKDPDEDIDIGFYHNPFPTLLRGTSDKSPFYSMSSTASQELVDAVRRAKNVKNLILVHARSTTVDYFLVDLAAATILCSGTFDANADPKLGARSDDYDIVTKNKKTGKEVKREAHHDVHDDRAAALWADANKKLAAHMKAELGINTP